MTLVAATESVPIKLGPRQVFISMLGDQTQRQTQNRCFGDEHTPKGRQGWQEDEEEEEEEEEMKATSPVGLP